MHEKELVEDYKERYARVKGKLKLMEEEDAMRKDIELSLSRNNAKRFRRIKYSMSGLSDDLRNSSVLLSQSQVSPILRQSRDQHRLERLNSMPSSPNQSKIFDRAGLDQQ